jgi:hypothetical protein
MYVLAVPGGVPTRRRVEGREGLRAGEITRERDGARRRDRSARSLGEIRVENCIASVAWSMTGRYGGEVFAIVPGVSLGSKVAAYTASTS